MHRRQFLNRVTILAAGGLVAAPRRPGAQDPDADPLRMPGAVQQRTVVTDAQNDPVVKGIEQRLKCTCGCNLDIYVCRTTDFTCGISPEMHKEVVALMEAGNTPDQVVAAFVEKYGEEVLMAPKPEGFNLAGYLVPGAVLLTASGLLAALLLRRHRVAAATAGMPAGAPDGPAAIGATGDELARLEQALQEVDR